MELDRKIYIKHCVLMQKVTRTRKKKIASITTAVKEEAKRKDNRRHFL